MDEKVFAPNEEDKRKILEYMKRKKCEGFFDEVCENEYDFAFMKELAEEDAD